VRRFRESIAPAATVIGPGTRIVGALSGDDGVELSGSLEGDSDVSGHYTVREGASVVGNLKAAGLVVDGEVFAETLSAERIEIGASARVRGDIRGKFVAIAEGAFFDGQVHMEGREAPAEPTFFKERRKSPSPPDGTPTA
jgi:cytoskeletal protein CcmA (bactofilin family)